VSLTHLDPEGRPVMVDVSAKAVTRRRAAAAGYLQLDPDCAAALEAGGGPKGDPWSTARIGAVGGAKRAWELIPLAHPLALDGVTVEHHWDAAGRRAWFRVEVTVEGRTGVEMEALAGVSAGLLVLYDMLKAVSHRMEIGPVRLLLKEGGRRGRIEEPWPGCPWK
jgi:cyclic pyranopterin phosphate synthase